MALLADYAITPDVFDVTSYSTAGECDARLDTIREAMLTEGLVRDLRNGAWSGLFRSGPRPWHRRGQELLKKMKTQGRFLRVEPALPDSPVDDRAWCAEALATDDGRPFQGGVITTNSVKEAYAGDRRVARIDRLSSAQWWTSRSPSVRLERTLADYKEHVDLVLRFSNSLMFCESRRSCDQPTAAALSVVLTRWKSRFSLMIRRIDVLRRAAAASLRPGGPWTSSKSNPAAEARVPAPGAPSRFRLQGGYLMNSDTVDADMLRIDDMHVVHRGRPDSTCTRCTSPPRCASARPAAGRPVPPCGSSALPDGLRAMTDWLQAHGVTAAAMEGTGVYWKAPFEALEDAGIHADLLHAQHVKQIRGKKTDTNDSLWLARICQFGPALPSYVPSRLFRQLTRYRRKLVGMTTGYPSSSTNVELNISRAESARRGRASGARGAGRCRVSRRAVPAPAPAPARRRGRTTRCGRPPPARARRRTARGSCRRPADRRPAR